MGPRGVIHLDTHVAVWLYLEDESRIPAAVRRTMDVEDLVVAPMVVLEMEYLHEIGRLTDPPAAVMASLSAGAGLQVSKASFAACVDAALGLTWTRDPFDRLIVGTAVAERAPLVTADRVVREHHAGCLWA